MFNKNNVSEGVGNKDPLSLPYYCVYNIYIIISFPCDGNFYLKVYSVERKRVIERRWGDRKAGFLLICFSLESS